MQQSKAVKPLYLLQVYGVMRTLCESHRDPFSWNSWKKTLARHGRAAALGVGLTAHLVAAAACASQGALLTRRPARQAVLRRPSVRVAFVTRCANSAVQSA